MLSVPSLAMTRSGRLTYARIHEVTDGISDDKFEVPNLIELQLESFQWFIEKGLRDAIADCAAQIVSYQAEEARRRTLDDSEKLRSLTLDEIVFDDARLAVTARVGLLSAAGRLQFAVPLRQGL